MPKITKIIRKNNNTFSYEGKISRIQTSKSCASINVPYREAQYLLGKKLKITVEILED